VQKDKMKKILLIILMSFFSGILTAQNISIRLAKTDIVDIAQNIKQDMVGDSIVSAAKFASLKSCEDALKRAANLQTINVPVVYIQNVLNRYYSDYEQFEYARKNRNKFLRILKQISANDPDLKVLQNDWFYNIQDLEKIKNQIKGSIE